MRWKLKIPFQDCVLLYLKWLKWNESMKSLSLPFGCGKSTIHEIINKMGQLLLRWADQYIVHEPDDQLTRHAQQRFHETYHNVVYVVDTVPCKIPQPSSPLAREYYNVHKKYYHIKTQAVVNAKGDFIDISPTVKGATSDITLFRDSGFGEYVTSGKRIAADAIYQGIAPFLNGGDIIIPHRREQGTLSDTQEFSNSFHSSYRVVVEHSFGRLKRFQVMGFFRGDHWQFNNIFRICCGLCNAERREVLIESRYSDTSDPEMNLLPGTRHTSISSIADDFIVYRDNGYSSVSHTEEPQE